MLEKLIFQDFSIRSTEKIYRAEVHTYQGCIGIQRNEVHYFLELATFVFLLREWKPTEKVAHPLLQKGTGPFIGMGAVVLFLMDNLSIF